MKEQEDLFLQDKITVEDFWDFFNKNKSTAKKYEPWRSAEWKNKKSIILKSKCECCGAKENLIAQHGWRPKKYKEHWYQTKMMFEKQSRVLHNDSNTEILSEVRVASACPKCGSENFKQRKDGTFKCYNKSFRTVHEYNSKTREEKRYSLKAGFPSPPNPEWETPTTPPDLQIWIHRKKCDFVFSQPTEHIRPETRKEFSERKKILNEPLLNEIKTVATKSWILEGRRYRSLENIKTYCKSCAFKEDKQLGLI